jgi:hypothetical protein
MLMAKKKKASELLIPPKNGLAVRMYRHGLGDCFLLAFDRPSSKPPCYVLIDCGVHMRQKKGSARMREVMANLIKATGGKLDIVVVTHEHADHLSGFVQKGSPFIYDRFKIDRFWVAWTEKVGDPQADQLRAKHGATRKTIQEAVEKLRQRNALNLANRLTGLMDFESMPLDSLAASARAKAGSNEVALCLLKQNAKKVEYCEPGETRKLPGVNKSRAYVLGPPRDEVLLKRDKPAKGSGRETYLTGRAQQLTFFQAPALRSYSAYQNMEARKRDLCNPFKYAFRREYFFGVKDLKTHWRKDNRAPLDIRSFYKKNYFSAGEDWRRIDTDWLTAAEQLALDLDNDTNNTSLTLAFEWGNVGQGHIFLFVGDAQVGNWLSWRSQTYKVNRRTFSADDLLARTILYKVGHHGSHNATVKRDPLHTSSRYPQGEPFGLELMPSRLIAMIPVDQAAVRRRMPRPWHMPHAPLYKRLLEKAGGRVLRSDGLKPSSEGIQLESHSPKSARPSRVPGFDNVKWRQSSDKFKNGFGCPLYYDLMFNP